MARPHAGRWTAHQDDCRCVEADMFCNRGGCCWSCCGATLEDSDCTAGERVHPTHWTSPEFPSTIARVRDDGWPELKPEYRRRPDGGT